MKKIYRGFASLVVLQPVEAKYAWMLEGNLGYLWAERRKRVKPWSLRGFPQLLFGDFSQCQELLAGDLDIWSIEAEDLASLAESREYRRQGLVVRLEPDPEGVSHARLWMNVFEEKESRDQILSLDDWIRCARDSLL